MLTPPDWLFLVNVIGTFAAFVMLAVLVAGAVYCASVLLFD